MALIHIFPQRGLIKKVNKEIKKKFTKRIFFSIIKKRCVIMSNLKGCFLHKSDHWATPEEIYKSFMDSNYFDPCPLHCSKFDGLKIEWTNKAFVNPPYSQIDKWVDKAIIEAKKGCEIVMLLPVRTDTKWFFKLYRYGVAIQFLRGRLKFGGSKNSAPFPSMFVWLDHGNHANDLFVVAEQRRFYNGLD